MTRLLEALQNYKQERETFNSATPAFLFALHVANNHITKRMISLKNNYEIDWLNEKAYIEAFASDGEAHTITISLNKLEMIKECTASWTLYGKNKLYARGYVKDEQGKSRRIEMHRYLTDCPKESIVDHRDGNGLNNYDDNLRICNHTANNQNAAMRKDNTTGFIGVSRLSNGKFRASIWVDSKNIHIGTFVTAEEASDAYQRKKQLLHPHADKNAMIFI